MSVYVSQECCLYSEACLEAISESTPHGLHTAVRTGLQVPGKIILLDRGQTLVSWESKLGPFAKKP
jgi:hypothetical protein